MFHNMPYANQRYFARQIDPRPHPRRLEFASGRTRRDLAARRPRPDGFQMRRSANAALATDQAARKPARMMSATFQASLFLGPRRGSIGGMAWRTRMTAIKMPAADATAACTGVAKGNMTVRMSDKVITSPRRHNPRRWETKRSTTCTRFAISRRRPMERLDQDHPTRTYVCRPGRTSQIAARPAGLRDEHTHSDASFTLWVFFDGRRRPTAFLRH